MGDISRDFSEWELHVATQGGTASPEAVKRFRNFWVPQLLQPARRIFGEGVYITSADRNWGGPAHQQGDASALDLGVAGNDVVKLRQLHTILATYFTDRFGRAILEDEGPDPHIHVTRQGPEGWAGYGVVLEETADKVYAYSSLPIPAVPALFKERPGLLAGILLALAAAGLAYLLLA